MKNILIILGLLLSSNFVLSQNYNFGKSYSHHIKKLKIERDGLAITLDGKKGNKWATNPINAKKIAKEIIRRYKRKGGKKKIRTSNLTVEIQVHATLYMTGKFNSRAKEINTIWSDLTKRYTKIGIAKRIYRKLKKKLKRKVTQRDIERIIA